MFEKIKLALEVVFYHPWKIMHEITILVLASIFARVKENRLIPKMENDGITHSKVVFASESEIVTALISIAPVLWWIGFYIFTKTLGLVLIYPLEEYLYITIHTSQLTVTPVWQMYIAFLLFAAGMPKKEELKKFFIGMITPSGFIFLIICSIIAKLYLKYGGF